jgi:hypothetical protein
VEVGYELKSVPAWNCRFSTARRYREYSFELEDKIKAVEPENAELRDQVMHLQIDKKYEGNPSSALISLVSATQARVRCLEIEGDIVVFLAAMTQRQECEAFLKESA